MSVPTPFPLKKLLACAAACAALWSAPAHALRPFEGTDASVAEPGVFELELGPLSYTRFGGQRSIAAPSVVGNFGFGGDFEVVIEGKLNRTIGRPEEGYRTSAGDTALSIKHVLRKGSLQEGGTGASVAMECGLLLPEYHGNSQTGGLCSGIVSQKFDFGVVHLNGALSRTREHTQNRFLGVIAEGGTEESELRPVMELFAERENNGLHTQSALVGMLWRHSDDLVFDVAVRHARSDGLSLNEVKFGLTWSYAMHK